MSNLLLYSIQLAAVVLAAALIRPALRIRIPAAKLLFWQVTLAGCLLMPLVRPWKQNLASGSVTVTTSVIGSGAVSPSGGWTFSWNDALVVLLCGGIVLRLLWLAAGMIRLGRLRRNSTPLRHEGIRLSHDLKSPVTFGFFRPVILLPANFPDLHSSAQEAILCHENLHIERRDWLFTVAEEVIRAGLWFHPAIWWMLSEIQLAREQAVDDAAIRNTRTRDRYVDALLVIAGADLPDLAPAPLFLRKRHLKQRVFSILKEVRMSPSKTYSALAAGLAVMAGLAWFVSGAIPLIAQTPTDSVGVSVDIGAAELIHRSAVIYPPAALQAHTEGTVVVSATLGPTGAVKEASAVSGPDELRAAAIRSIRDWHFTKESAPIQQIMIVFHIPSDSGVTVKAIQIEGISDSAAKQLRAQLPVHEGDPVTPDLIRQVRQAAAAFDEHLRATDERTSDTTSTIRIWPGPSSGGPIRIGGNVQQANLLTKVTPAYPPDAKAARVQGTVKLQVRISPEGRVEDVQLLDGPQLLTASAINAVSQWTYRPTLLNGSPIEVLTTVDVNYTLTQ